MNREMLILSVVATALAVSACGKKQEPPPPAAPAAPSAAAPGAPQGMPPAGMPGMPGMSGAPGAAPATPPVPREVVVPADVQKGWKSVVLALTDKKTNKTEDVKVEIGQTFKKGDFEITVEAFLPAFTMGGGNITSKNNNPENPAAKVVVKDKGNQVYAGWLFSLYPQAHPMQHEQWAVVLKDFVKK